MLSNVRVRDSLDCLERARGEAKEKMAMGLDVRMHGQRFSSVLGSYVVVTTKKVCTIVTATEPSDALRKVAPEEEDELR